MQIVHIQYPHVITDTGEKIDIANIEGMVMKGRGLELQDNGVYKVLVNTNDSECVSGVCPIK